MDSEQVILRSFADTMKETASEIITTFQKARAFYENDLDEIKFFIKKELENNYNAETLDHVLRYQHRDGIQKMLRRKTSGIFEPRPSRRLIMKDGKEWDGLIPLLDKWRWNKMMKESLKQAIFFNTVLVQAAWRNNGLKIDLWSGDNAQVVTMPNDVLVPKEIYLLTVGENNDVIIVYWSENDHYIIDSEGAKSRSYGDRALSNKYKLLPFNTLRIRDSNFSFWGEVNNNMLQNQMELDIAETNFILIQEFQSFGIPIGVNLGASAEFTFSPGKGIFLDNQRTDMQVPDLKFVVPPVNFDGLINNMNYFRQTAYQTEGLANQSYDKSDAQASGVSKSFDELELEEQRDEFRSMMREFEEEFLNICRVVHNSEVENSADKIPEGQFVVTYQDESKNVSILERIQRRKFNQENYLEDSIDFVMQDLGITEEEAIEHIAKRIERKGKISNNSNANIPISDRIRMAISTGANNQ